MTINKAVVTLAHPRQKTLPLQQFINGEGKSTTALHVLLDEAVGAGVESVLLVTCPGQEEAYRMAAGEHAERLTFVEQTEPRGYGDALLQARSFVDGDPFLHMVGDHLALSESEQRCSRQIISLARQEKCAVCGVQSTPESLLPYYGVVGGKLADQRKGIYLVEQVREKPSPTEAEQILTVPGLRAGYYLCFFGMHVFPPSLMEYLERSRENGGHPSLTRALGELAAKERFLALELTGRRFDVGVPYGFFLAQMAFALRGPDRDKVMAQVIELLALSRS